MSGLLSRSHVNALQRADCSTCLFRPFDKESHRCSQCHQLSDLSKVGQWYEPDEAERFKRIVESLDIDSRPSCPAPQLYLPIPYSWARPFAVGVLVGIVVPLIIVSIWSYL